jgi:CelD/BcsL family acetyltransferase involved in cellulose biosynthesis
MLHFTAALHAAGLTVHEKPGLNTWRIELPATWEEYVASLSKSHRKQVRRVERRLSQDGDLVLRRVMHSAELEKGLAILTDLHQRRRASLNEPGCFADPRFAGFLSVAAARLLATDSLWLYWIELAGQPIAAEFQLAGNGVTFAYQAGVAPEALDEEPGRVINIATIQQALAARQRGFDFLRGDEPYKAHWRAVPRASLELRIVPRKTSAQLRHSMWRAGDAVKQVLKSGLVLTARQ